MRSAEATTAPFDGDAPTIHERASLAADVLRRYVGPDQLPGGIVVAGSAEGLTSTVPVGAIDHVSGVPVASDTLYRLYCMTKPILGLAVARLVDEGRLGMDDPIDRHLPQFARPGVLDGGRETSASRAITVRDLLAHTGGLTMPIMNRGTLADRYLRAGLMAARIEIEALTRPMLSRPRDAEDYLDRLSSMPLAFHPGTGFAYGLSYDVLGFLVERLTGEPIIDHLRDRVLHPLGMVDTMLVVGDGDVARLATSYYRFDDDAKAPAYRRSEPDGQVIYSTPPSYVDAGNGLVSSARDYARLLDAIIAPRRHPGSLGRALAALPVDLLPADIDGGPMCEGGGYGIGGYVVRRRLRRRPSPGTYGWSGFGGTYFWVDFEAGYWMLVMAQYGPASSLGIKPRIVSTQYR